MWGDHNKLGSYQVNKFMPNCANVTVSRGEGEADTSRKVSEEVTLEPARGRAGEGKVKRNNSQGAEQEGAWTWKVETCRGQ